MDNSIFVKRAQKTLEKMGVPLKTTQLYELFSKLSGEHNWNVAKSKDIDFSKILVENAPILELANHLENFDLLEVVIRSLNEDPRTSITHIFEKDSPNNFYNLSLEINWENIGPVLVKVLDLSNADHVSGYLIKHVKMLAQAMRLAEKPTYRGIIYVNQNSIPPSVYKIAIENLVEFVDLEEFKRYLIKTHSK